MVVADVDDEERAEFFTEQLFRRKIASLVDEGEKHEAPLLKLAAAALVKWDFNENVVVDKSSAEAVLAGRRVLAVIMAIADRALRPHISDRIFDDAPKLEQAAAKMESSPTVWQAIGLALQMSAHWKPLFVNFIKRVGDMKSVVGDVRKSYKALEGLGIEPSLSAAQTLRGIVEWLPHIHAKTGGAVDELEAIVVARATDHTVRLAKMFEVGDSAAENDVRIDMFQAYTKLNSLVSNSCAVTDDHIRAMHELQQAKLVADTAERQSSIVDCVKAFDLAKQETWDDVKAALRGVKPSGLDDGARELIFQTACDIMRSPKVLASDASLLAVVKSCASVVDGARKSSLELGIAMIKAALDVHKALDKLGCVDGALDDKDKSKVCEQSCKELDACVLKVGVAVRKAKSTPGLDELLSAVGELHAQANTVATDAATLVVRSKEKAVLDNATLVEKFLSEDHDIQAWSAALEAATDIDEFTTHAGAAFAKADMSVLDNALGCLSRVPRYMTQAIKHNLFVRVPCQSKLLFPTTSHRSHAM